MAKTHGLYRYENGVGVPYCGQKSYRVVNGTQAVPVNLHVTASWEVVNCKKCLNAAEQHMKGKYHV